MKPQITIAVPSHNHAVKLLKTVQSVLLQTERNWELFIVDDQSTDSAWHVAQMLSHQDNRIHCEQNPHSLGILNSYHYAASKGQAPYLLLLNRGDQLTPHFLRYVMQCLDDNPSTALVCGRQIVFDPHTHRYVPYATPLRGTYSAGRTIARALANGNLYGSFSSVVINRNALASIGGIRNDDLWTHDFETFIQISTRCPITFVSDAEIYQHIDNKIIKSLLTSEMVDSEIATLNRLLSDSYVRQYLQTADIENAWHRIHALKWSAVLYQITHDWAKLARIRRHLQGQQLPISCSAGKILTTMARLIYQRYRLTY